MTTAYIVKAGDTLESIAEFIFGDRSMVGYLASINGIKYVNGAYAIKPGQEIKIEVAEISANKKSDLPFYLVSSTIVGAVIYWRADILNWFKKTF